MSRRRRNQSTSTSAVTARPVVVKKISNKRFNNIEDEFNSKISQVQGLAHDITSLEQTIKNKTLVIPPELKGGTERKIQLNSVQVKGLRKSLTDKKVELKFAQKYLKPLATKYTKACSLKVASGKLKVKNLNENIRLSRTANKESDALLGSVQALVRSLESKRDPRIDHIRQLATSDGRNFNTELFRIVKSGLRNPQHIKMIKASSQVRTSIFRTIRSNYGWVPKNNR